MIDLLMLGIVPGTNIQIDFGDWIRSICMLSLCMLLIGLVRHRFLTTLLLAYAISRSKKRITLHQNIAPRPAVALQ